MLIFWVSLNGKNNAMNECDKCAVQVYCNDLMNEIQLDMCHLTSLSQFVNSYSSAIGNRVKRRVGHVLQIRETYLKEQRKQDNQVNKENCSKLQKTQPNDQYEE